MDQVEATMEKTQTPQPGVDHDEDEAIEVLDRISSQYNTEGEFTPL